MVNPAQISVSNFSWLFAVAKYYGISESQLFKQFNVSAEDLTIPGTTVSIKKVNLIHEMIKQAGFGDELVLIAAENTNFGEFGVLDYLCTSSGTVLEGFNNLNKYFNILAPIHTTLKFIEKDNLGILNFYPDSLTSKLISWYEVETTEYVFALILNRIRYSTGIEVSPVKITFKYPKPKYHLEYSRIFNTELEFDASHYSMVFDSEALSLSHSQTSDPSLNKMIFKQAESAHLVDLESIEFKYKVIEALKHAFNNGQYNLDTILTHLNISQRTLHRKLANEGTNFSELRDNLIKVTAEQLLNDASNSIGYISDSLGYLNTTAFHRAFKRLTGISPSQYRKKSGG